MKLVKRMTKTDRGYNLGGIHLYNYALPMFAKYLNNSIKYGYCDMGGLDIECDKHDTELITISNGAVTIQITLKYAENLIDKHLQ